MRGSEYVRALLQNIAEVVYCRCVHHCAVVGDAAPDVSFHILVVLYRVLLHLLQVILLGGAVSASDAPIMASLQHITLIEGAVIRLLLRLRRLLRELHVRAIRRVAGVEASVLANCVRPGLIAMNDPIVLLGVLVSYDVLLALIRILSVANTVEVSEWISLYTSGEPSCRLRDRAFGRPKWLVQEL